MVRALMRVEQPNPIIARVRDNNVAHRIQSGGYWYPERPSSPVVPGMMDRFVNDCVNVVLGDVADLLGPAIQERFELLANSSFAFGGFRLLGREGYNDYLNITRDVAGD